MAAYAALLSLMTTLNNIQIHSRVSTFFDHKKIQSLHQIINSLLHFMDSSNSDGGSREEEEALERRIASTTHAAEDVIESHVVDQIHAGSADLLDLETIIEDMTSVKETVMEFRGTMKFEDEQSSPASSKPLTTTKKDLMVGFDERVIQIMDRLTAHQPNLQVIPIIGMGGIGKTTLAKNVYEHLLIVESFDIRAWITISQEYSVKYVLSELLSCIKDRNINIHIGAVDFGTELETEDHELGQKLYQALWGRKYLIVLDDMWSVEAWYKIKIFFPNDGHRSRVVITTRISSVATPLSSSSFEMNFLDEDQSWELFCGSVFLEKWCPPELEEIGKTIVRECKGLPLSIVVIGGLLRNSKRTREYWENFARDLNSILMSGNDSHCLNILSLSYNHLPAHLKPCFLYLGVLQGNKNLRISLLINLLVAEGFLKSKEGQTLEEIAEDYLNDLVDRNLILVTSRGWDGRIKYCKMHDLVKEVCLKIGERQKIFHIMKMLDIPASINGERRIMLYNTILEAENWSHVFYDLLTASLVRTFIYGGDPLPFKYRLLRVLTKSKFVSLEDIFQQVNLRYLDWNPSRPNPKLPSSVSLLWNVQTLILTGCDEVIMEAPAEIWYMRQLRNLQFDVIVLPDPPISEEVEQQVDALLPNLHTLLCVHNFSFTEKACKEIPNIKKLYIGYGEECQEKCYYDLGHLHKLQSLTCAFEAPKRDDFLQSLVFPSLLRKLTLVRCGLHWEDLSTFGFSLPNLEVLKLYYDAIVGAEWDCVEGAFPRLKFLLMEHLDLEKWTAESSEFFPVLEKLHLNSLQQLKKIPPGMGDIQTLASLYVDYCSVFVAISSMEILEEQLSLGNDDLQLEISYHSEGDPYLSSIEERFKEMVEMNNFASKNFKFRTRQ